MAHLSIEYSANLDETLDMAAFCEVARSVMAECGVFPVAGIRVRAFRADHAAISDGNPEFAFADMVLRMGKGRDEEVRLAACETVYAALEGWLAERLNQPFALSLEVLEINYPFAIKRMNTIRTALEGKNG